MNKRILTASLVLLTTASVAQAATYTVTLIGDSLGGLSNTPRALNDSGQIAGESFTTGNAQKGLPCGTAKQCQLSLRGL